MAMNNTLSYVCRDPVIVQTLRLITSRQKLKEYVFPEIRHEDCEQKFISGWGPGGQKVNTARNAVMLRHIPTGIVVKVHESRLLPKNIELAYERLKYAVDRHVNGEDCYEEQLKKLERIKEEKVNRRRKAARQVKRELID
ncbi:putative peptide chain release factor C12orf65 -like protein, mitochondrial [Toxocara canis]|nr:putative peptide chain release factor C12orf65 -like protein, mitochondrial [Toxocara canis]